jgi:GNAT superfamily N-acetyltransferase
MLIRPWRADDRLLVQSAQQHLSEASLSRRFLAGTGGRLPAAYLAHIAGGARPEWDAEVALGGGMLLGWAEYGRVPADGDCADLAVLVADPWQRGGLGIALVRALVPRMVDAGVRTVEAHVAPGNTAARAFARALTRAEPSSTFSDGLVRYSYALNAREHSLVTG